MAHSYTDEDIAQLGCSSGQRLYGDGALVVLKALLESGISYFGGYPGSPTANLMDAVADAYEPILKEMGIYFESSSSEVSAGALLTTSVYGPVRGAVTWKVVGNGVATDVVDHVSQLGVKDGAMMIIGEDYGVSSTTVVQRTLAWGVKSGLLVIDPRGDQQVLHRMVKESMDLSRDSQCVAALLLRPQLSHTNAQITVGDNRIPAISQVRPVESFAKDPTLFALPPFAQQQELHRYNVRIPAAKRLIVERGLNEYFGNDNATIGLITHGTTFNTTWRILEQFGLIDEADRVSDSLHWLHLNIVHPLSETQMLGFFSGKREVLLIEEGQPDLIETQLRALIQREKRSIEFHGHDIVPGVGELLPERLMGPLARYLDRALGNIGAEKIAARFMARMQMGIALFPTKPPARVPTFCTGCPERPVFAQMKLKEKLTGVRDWHASDVGCYGMAGFKPFEMSDSNIGMGAGLAAASGITAMSKQRNVSVVGDGTLWHSAFNASAVNAIYNKQEATYIVLDNKWTAMTGAHENPNVGRLMNGEAMNTQMRIDETFRAMGVKQIEKANPYDFKSFQRKLEKIQGADHEPQVRVLISEAECQLQRQRRVKAEQQADLKAGRRVVIEQFGVDSDICVGDHSCIRFNGCPSLTLKPTQSKLRYSAPAFIDSTCVGCGVCGEIAQMGGLCPSFYRITQVINPGLFERARNWLRQRLIPNFADRGRS